MNKLAKGFLLALAALAGVLLLALLLVNLYVESENVQTRLETAVSRELRMPVKLTRVRFSFWSGLKLDGVTVPSGEEPFFHAPKISARVEWGPLFSRRLVVRELLISSPKVVWLQTRKGKWRLPKIEQAPLEGATPEPSTPKTKDKKQQEEADTQDGIAKDEKREEKKEERKKKKVEFRVAFARIHDASFHFLDREGRPIAVFEGVSVNIPTAAKGEARGDATIRKLTLRDSIIIEEITTPFVFEEGRLTLPQVDARLAGGAVRGDFALQPEEDGAPFALQVQFSDVDLNRLITEAGSDEGLQKAEGKLHGSVSMQGKSGQKKSIEGRGQAKLSQGKMEQYPLLQMLGQTLQIDELSQLELHKAQLDVRIGNGRVYVDSLTLESTNLNLNATGDVRFDGKLSLDAGLAINQKISRQIPKWVLSNFKPLEGDDRKSLPFTITGTLQRPETDLVRVLMGEKIERQATDLLRAFRDLAGGNKKNSSEKKKKKASDDRKGSKKSDSSTPQASDRQEENKTETEPSTEPEMELEP